MATTFTAVPIMQCHSPAKAFDRADEALRFAEDAAQKHRIGYVVWQRQNGRLKRLKTFAAK
jgi:hypothetical protein